MSQVLALYVFLHRDSLSQEKLGDRAVMRAIHYYTDCRRVDQQVEALEKGEFERFLRLVSSSGHSSYMYLQNVDTYRDPASQPVAVALAMARYYLKGRGACRVTYIRPVGGCGRRRVDISDRHGALRQ